jgi:lipoprotein-releasing system ATP-binding protein
MSVLVAESITKAYPRAGRVVNNVSLDVHQGELIALVGPSGAGKSTLLHILATLDAADSGSIFLQVDGRRQDLSKATSAQLATLRNNAIGFIFQFHHLLPEFSAVENAMMPALIAGQNTTKARTLAMALLEKVGMAHRADHRPAELSGGEQQRVAIARALINNPCILFADEPTGNLDSANATAVVELLASLQAEYALTCVIATHSTDLASRATRVLRMKDGSITT